MMLICECNHVVCKMCVYLNNMLYAKFDFSMQCQLFFVSLSLAYPLLLSLLSVLTFGDSEELDHENDALAAGVIRSENYPQSSSTRRPKIGFITMKPQILWTTFKLISNSSYLEDGAKVVIASESGTGPQVSFASDSDSPVSQEQPPGDTSIEVTWHPRRSSLSRNIEKELPAYQLQFQG